MTENKGRQSSDASGSDENDDDDDGSGDAGQTEEVTLDGLKKSVDGLQSLVGKWGNEVKEVREFKDQFKTLTEQVESLGKKSNNKNNQQQQNQHPIELSAEDEQKINERWKAFPQDKREQMIDEAEGANRQEKISNVRTELSRLYADEGVPVPDELFPNNPDASTKGRTKRAANTISSLGREMLGLKERENKTRIPPGGGGGAGGTNRGGGAEAGTSPSKRGSTSGGLSGLTSG